MSLKPLAWTVQHGAVITADDELHRWGCQSCDGLARIVKPAMRVLAQRHGAS